MFKARGSRTVFAVVVALATAAFADPLVARQDTRRAECELRCDIDSEGYEFDVTCEKGASSEKLMNESTKFEYSPSGALAGLVVAVNRERTYSASNRTYHITGTIGVDKANNRVTYDVQASGGAFGATPGVCKGSTAGERAKADPPPAPSPPPRVEPLNLAVDASYQPAITVPACKDALLTTTTLACFVSERSEYVGQGKTWILRGDVAPMTVEYKPYSGGVAVQVKDGADPGDMWNFELSAPKNAKLRAGLFENTARNHFQDETRAGLSASGHSSACGEETGRFEILELLQEPQGAGVLKLALNFEQICQGKYLRGVIRFNSSVK
ncbi:MAG TPA: hypothetical protein VMR52_00015 [Dehalococcoidia bacterium]|nr:hypothetical protein [Dehalococcoidia bacterium]